jgi:predicted amino acid racemase
MLLERMLERNPAMAEAAVHLHQDGQVPAGSWLFDLDAIDANARAIATEARRLGLHTYLMTKQLARNPFVAAVALNAGLSKTVAVDIRCARLLWRYRIPVGHIGHLNQIPMHEVRDALAMRPDYVTVYSVEAARRVSDAARDLGRPQDLLLQIYAPEDVYFPGQEGGFRTTEALAAARAIAALPDVTVAGVTSFPVIEYDYSGEREVAFTPNMRTIVQAAEQIRTDLGLPVAAINAPGNTSTATLAMLREGGATHVEPGCGVMGSTPAQMVEPDHVEIPAYTFVTEISHHYEDAAYGIANGALWTMLGGFTPADWPMGAMVGRTPEAALANRMAYRHLDQIIDYHIPLLPRDAAAIGDTVVFPTYTQAHMTRAQVVPVSGIQRGNPRVWGVFDQAATMVDRDWNPVPPATVMRLIDEAVALYR